MKSYWISATVVLLAALPSGAKALVAGVMQNEKPAAQAQISQSTSATPAMADVKTQVEGVATPAAVAPVKSQPQNSFMLVELDKSLKAKKLKAGDKIKASVTQDVISHGKLIIPVETELVGHVTEVSVRDGASHQSRLGIVFDKILLKHFRDVTFKAVIQAVSPPAARPSRVDQPSQMLPPSMMGGGARTTSTSPMGGSGSGSGSRSSQSTASSATTATARDTSTFQVPLTVKQSNVTNASVGSTAASLQNTSGGKPMSIGMPEGVRGIKGLSLDSSPSASTPGPVIVSDTDDVKLESGTQILLRVIQVEMPR